MLSKSIGNAIQKLKLDPKYGIPIPKNLIPDEYLQKYGVDNLWKYNLSRGWRLIYTIKKENILLLVVLLEWFDHKNYERRFGY